MDWLEPFVVPAALGLAALIAGSIGYFIRGILEENRRAEERLASDRRKLYTDLLDPYTRAIHVGLTGQSSEAIEERVKSPEYWRTALEVVLIGSDEVVNAYNDLVQQFSSGKANRSDSAPQFENFRLYGVLLLAIRKSLGNWDTALDERGMLKHVFTDLNRAFEDQGEGQPTTTKNIATPEDNTQPTAIKKVAELPMEYITAGLDEPGPMKGAPDGEENSLGLSWTFDEMIHLHGTQLQPYREEFAEAYCKFELPNDEDSQKARRTALKRFRDHLYRARKRASPRQESQ